MGFEIAEGRIAPDNTIVPLGVRNPGITRLPDGKIGSCNNQRKSQLPDLSSVIYLVSFLEFSHTICK